MFKSTIHEAHVDELEIGQQVRSLPKGILGRIAKKIPPSPPERYPEETMIVIDWDDGTQTTDEKYAMIDVKIENGEQEPSNRHLPPSERFTCHTIEDAKVQFPKLVQLCERIGETLTFAYGRPILTEAITKHLNCPYPPYDDRVEQMEEKASPPKEESDDGSIPRSKGSA